MGAVVSLTDFPQPNRRMKIPLQTEVAKFMEEVRFQEDVDKLNKCKKQIKDMDMAAALRFFDGILTAYKAGLKPDKESAFQMYDYLKNMGIMKLTKEEIEQCRLKAGNNNDVAKLWALRFFLDKMVQRGLTFKDYVR